jgi:glycosyltransferase involved in cell wall biosynthesis
LKRRLAAAEAAELAEGAEDRRVSLRDTEKKYVNNATTPFTVVIAARNEAGNIAACISSVSFASEILVVEDGSSDDTVALARDAEATVLQHPFQTIGMQRNFAIENAFNPWILVIDADERGSPGLGDEIARVISNAGYDAYRIPRRNLFLGAEVRHGGWESDKPIRLFKSSLRYNASRVHEHVEVNGPIGELISQITHEPYVTLDSWFEKLGRYSKWWAEDRFDKGKRTGIASVVFRPPLRFLTMYVIRGGWMDGARGALLASMAATSVMAKYARLWALGINKA